MLNLVLKKTLQGKILDIGGGGEGVIGRIYQAQVTAIDNRQEELDEAPDGFRKLLMDARALAFPDASFDHVTAFYALMYMPKPVHCRAPEQFDILFPGYRRYKRRSFQPLQAVLARLPAFLLPEGHFHQVQSRFCSRWQSPLFLIIEIWASSPRGTRVAYYVCISLVYTSECSCQQLKIF